MGRPKKSIDFNKVDDYLTAQCSGSAIAGLLGVHPDTLYRAIEDKHKMTFTAYSEQKRAEGRDLLKMTLWQTAIKGNAVMQIWLSKQYLGFADNIDRLSDEAIEQVIQRLKLKYHETTSN